jgi:hypothetical protein
MALLFPRIRYKSFVRLALSEEPDSITVENFIGPEETGSSKVVSMAFWLYMLDGLQESSDTNCVESSRHVFRLSGGLMPVGGSKCNERLK